MAEKLRAALAHPRGSWLAPTAPRCQDSPFPSLRKGKKKNQRIPGPLSHRRRDGRAGSARGLLHPHASPCTTHDTEPSSPFPRLHPSVFCFPDTQLGGDMGQPPLPPPGMGGRTQQPRAGRGGGGGAGSCARPCERVLPTSSSSSPPPPPPPPWVQGAPAPSQGAGCGVTWRQHVSAAPFLAPAAPGAAPLQSHVRAGGGQHVGLPQRGPGTPTRPDTRGRACPGLRASTAKRVHDCGQTSTRAWMAMHVV
ncbi:cuticle collagen 2C-like isoform X2 [Calypte anna]|nr:cuticle collagen 2C-like isoform X2 [Calypte anna]